MFARLAFVATSRKNASLAEGDTSPSGTPENHTTKGIAIMEKTEQRSFMLRVRLTEQEAERYKLKAKKEGITLSELVRKSLESHQTIVISGYDDEMKKLFLALSRIGNYQKKLDKTLNDTHDYYFEYGDMDAEYKALCKAGMVRLQQSRNELITINASLKKLLLEIKNEVEKHGISQTNQQ